MFWKSKLEKALENEIDFLRKENKELRIQLIALSGNSGHYYNAKIAEKKTEYKTPEQVIEEKPATTPEQRKLKADAKRWANGVFNN